MQAAGQLCSFETEALFLQVVGPHLATAQALARSSTRSVPDAEDVVQDGCLRAFRGIAGFTGANARAWVLTIVRHAAYDFLAKRRRVPEPVENVEELDLRQDCTTPEVSLMLDQDASQVAQAIRALPMFLQNAVVLRYKQGLTYLEIAKATGVPTGTVMSRLWRAHRQLGTMLEERAA